MTSSQARLSIVMATRNGASVLAEVLEGYERLTQASLFELLVVNNGSTDETSTLLHAAAGRLPLTVISEERPGKNRCLNLALPHVRGELIILTDDDAIPDPGFLTAWSAMLDDKLEYEVFGATVQPRFPASPSPYLECVRRHFPELYAENVRPSGEIASHEVFGPNMAVRRSVLEEGHRFDENLGPDGSKFDYAMGSESEFCDRLARAGKRFWFNAPASVSHIVRPQQMTEDFVHLRAFRHGRGVGYRQCAERSGRPAIARGLTRARSLLRMAVLASPRSPDPEAAWDYHWKRGFYQALAGG